MRIANTLRTVIDKIALSDAAFYLELVNNPTWLRFIGDKGIHDLKTAEDHLKNGFLDHYETRGYSYYVVRLARGQEIGVCGFLKKPYLEHEDFGFAFLPAYQGQGYGFEAGRAILDFGIRQFGFSALDAVTVPDNEASIRLLEKLGFVYLGPVEEPDTKTQLCLYRWTGKSRNH